jgi:putative NADH-flavin reductase
MSVRRITVFGATGRTGKALIREALDLGLDITAYVRSPVSLRGMPDSLHVVEGGLDDAGRIGETVAGSDAVVIALGPRQDNPAAICAPATERIIQAMREHRVRRLLCVTGALIGEGYANRGLFYRLMRALLVKRIPWLMQDRDEQERLVRQSGLDWTVFKPPRLINGPEDRVMIGADLSIGCLAKATVDGLAAVLLRESLEPQFVEKAVFIKSS